MGYVSLLPCIFLLSFIYPRGVLSPLAVLGFFLYLIALMWQLWDVVTEEEAGKILLGEMDKETKLVARALLAQVSSPSPFAWKSLFNPEFFFLSSLFSMSCTFLERISVPEAPYSPFLIGDARRKH